MCKIQGTVIQNEIVAMNIIKCKIWHKEKLDRGTATDLHVPGMLKHKSDKSLGRFFFRDSSWLNLNLKITVSIYQNINVHRIQNFIYKWLSHEHHQTTIKSPLKSTDSETPSNFEKQTSPISQSESRDCSLSPRVPTQKYPTHLQAQSLPGNSLPSCGFYN